MCVTDPRRNRCLLIEDFKFELDPNGRHITEILNSIFDNHHLLMAGFWNNIKLSVKNKKFTLISAPLFSKDSLYDYLTLSCPINQDQENLYYYKHHNTDAVNVFAADKELLDWLGSIYKKLNIQVIHQGSAIIEGVLKNDDHSHEKSMFIFVDRGMLHIMVAQNKKLLYYNQFAAKSTNEALRYIFLVMKALRLSQQSSKVLLWGNISGKSALFKALYKYIRNISFGNKPKYLSFNYMFDELYDHQYFDLYSMYLCD